MNYTIIFYISILVFLYQSIAGNQNMLDQSFRLVTILGLTAIISLLSHKK